MKILLVADNCSRKMGGEAILPYHYFRLLPTRGHSVGLIVHSRNRQELEQLFPGDARIQYIEETGLQTFLWKVGTALPRRLAEVTIGVLLQASTDRRMRALARRRVAEEGFEVVHQVIPVSPRSPSKLRKLGAPVVIGPMNGGMSFPPAFRQATSPVERAAYAVAKSLSRAANWFSPGKREAALLLVANARTEAALRQVVSGSPRIQTLVENAVDFRLWTPAAADPGPDTGRADFVFVGRLVDWKAVDLALEALARAPRGKLGLHIVGSGDQEPVLRAAVDRLQIGAEVVFHGFLPQEEVRGLVARSRALVLPSLYECGGAVVLEAMALGRAVIATRWGGPEDYLDESCGYLIAPDSREVLIEGFRKAMEELADHPEKARALGEAGFRKVREGYDWDQKVAVMEDLYRSVLK